MKVYIASKTKYAYRWQALRKEGHNIISTWIDEAEVGQTSGFNDLWDRCLSEASNADRLILYTGVIGDLLKGALIEVGAALAHHVPVVIVGPLDSIGTIYRYHLVHHAESIEEALTMEIK